MTDPLNNIQRVNYAQKGSMKTKHDLFLMLTDHLRAVELLSVADVRREYGVTAKGAAQVSSAVRRLLRAKKESYEGHGREAVCLRESVMEMIFECEDHSDEEKTRDE